MQAGQTGHYVLSTIHTIDRIEVITRLKKMGISSYDIASTLVTVVSQRLIRKICPKCAIKREFTDKEIDIIKKIGDKYGCEFDLKDKFTYTAKGCNFCNGTGYYERIGMFEVLEINDELKELIMTNGTVMEIRDAALRSGYKPLIVDGIHKVVDGITTLEELNKKIIIF